MQHFTKFCKMWGTFCLCILHLLLISPPFSNLLGFMNTASKSYFLFTNEKAEEPKDTSEVLPYRGSFFETQLHSALSYLHHCDKKATWGYDNIILAQSFWLNSQILLSVSMKLTLWLSKCLTATTKPCDAYCQKRASGCPLLWAVFFFFNFLFFYAHAVVITRNSWKWPPSVQRHIDGGWKLFWSVTWLS